MNGEPDVLTQAQCPTCHHGNEPMGRLGDRTHFRCRGCGMMYSTTSEAAEDFDDLYRDVGGGEG